MANLPWFKFFGSDYISDQKVLELSACERSCWITLLSYASQNDGVIKNMSEHKLMTQAGVNFMEEEWNQTQGVLKHFKKLGMIRIDNGVITVSNWGKRQERSMTPYERVKRHREKVKSETDDNEKETHDNAKDNKRIDKSREEERRKENFERWWGIYSKKVAKQKAWLAFKKVSASEHEPMYQHTLKAIRSDQWLKDGGQYIPNPTTYLNQERWKDQVELPKTVSLPKLCRICGKEATLEWVAVSGGVAHIECRDLPDRSEKLRDMKAGFIKTTKI